MPPTSDTVTSEMQPAVSVTSPLLVGAAAAQKAAVITSTNNIFPMIQGLLALSTVPILISLMVAASQKHSGSYPYLYRIMWAGAFLLNLITVSLPGRFDGAASVSTGRVEFPWNTVFAPAPWAFAIWGVIYLSETLLVGWIAALGLPIQALKNAAPYWVAGNMFQAVWTFLFRPKFRSLLWLPMSALALGSACLFGAQGELTKAILPSMSVMEKVTLIALRSPISLHASWLTAASLLNLNAWVSLSGASLGFQVAVGFASAYFAAIAGAAFSILRGDPLVALVIAWALAALSSQTREKCQVATLPESTVHALALTEKVLSNILIGTAIAAPSISKALF